MKNTSCDTYTYKFILIYPNITKSRESSNNRGRDLSSRVLSFYNLFRDNEKKKKKEEADLGGSASRHVFRVYNELSGFWKNLEKEEKILVPESRSLWMDFARGRDFSVTFRTFGTSPPWILDIIASEI